MPQQGGRIAKSVYDMYCSRDCHSGCSQGVDGLLPSSQTCATLSGPLSAVDCPGMPCVNTQGCLVVHVHRTLRLDQDCLQCVGGVCRRRRRAVGWRRMLAWQKLPCAGRSRAKYDRRMRLRLHGASRWAGTSSFANGPRPIQHQADSTCRGINQCQKTRKLESSGRSLSGRDPDSL